MVSKKRLSNSHGPKSQKRSRNLSNNTNRGKSNRRSNTNSKNKKNKRVKKKSHRRTFRKGFNSKLRKTKKLKKKTGTQSGGGPPGRDASRDPNVSVDENSSQDRIRAFSESLRKKLNSNMKQKKMSKKKRTS